MMRCVYFAPVMLLAVQGFRIKASKKSESALELITTFGGGSDVCEPEKGFFFHGKRPSDGELVERLEDKQRSLIKLAKWLDDTHCIFGLKHGKVCMGKWLELGQRISKIMSCAKVPRDMNSPLSKAVWGEGDLNLKRFLLQVNMHIGMALTKNKHVQKYLLKPSGCELSFHKIPQSVERHVKDENRSAVVDMIVADVMGQTCDVNKAPPLKVFRSSLIKTIKQTVEEIRDGDVNAPIERMNRERKAMEDPEFVERLGHELADEDSGDARDAVRKVEAGWAERTGLLEVASDVVGADPVKLLVWLLLFLLTGPIALIIWLVFLVLGRHDLAGI